jgi:hypothetical protein
MKLALVEFLPPMQLPAWVLPIRSAQPDVGDECGWRNGEAVGLDQALVHKVPRNTLGKRIIRQNIIPWNFESVSPILEGAMLAPRNV